MHFVTNLSFICCSFRTFRLLKKDAKAIQRLAGTVLIL